MKADRLAVAAALCLAATVHAQNAPKSELEGDKRAVHVCAACHGDNGRSSKKLVPSLAGQMREYTIRQLKDFRSQSRAETDIQAYMWGISALLNDETIEGLADHYAQQPPAPPKSRHARLEAAGRKIFDNGIPEKSVRACSSCHGNDAEGEAGFPRLAGLDAEYVVKQLQAFRTPLRKHGVIMKNETRALSDAQMRAAAAYVQSR
jgi:cytochrome c553